MKIFILESDNANSYKVAIHFTTPAGNNTAGMSWKACALRSGSIGTTILNVGTEPGDISQAEHDSIISGDTIEIIRSINPGLDPSNTSVVDACNVCVAEYHADMARILKYYGHVIGA